PRFVIEHVPPTRVAQLPRANSPSGSPAPPVSDPVTPPADKPAGIRRYIPPLPFKFPFSN
ncbi:MAG TPA: hypothetical protein VMM76_23440, partial [Pirellulaceae bacterium]|nr:hypothetical protein [Pirellulaceae bacterium]